MGWSSEKMTHHHDEYYEGEHLHVWFDGNSKKTLVHAYEEDWFNHKGETHHIFSLRDYNKKFHWHGHWNHTLKKVTNCQLELFDNMQWLTFGKLRMRTRKKNFMKIFI